MMLARTDFARLAEDVALHVSPKGGTVMHGAARQALSVSRGTIERLLECDGSATLDAILGRVHAAYADSDPLALFETASELAGLVALGLICLEPIRSHRQLTVTGDLH